MILLVTFYSDDPSHSQNRTSLLGDRAQAQLGGAPQARAFPARLAAAMEPAGGDALRGVTRNRRSAVAVVRAISRQAQARQLHDARESAGRPTEACRPAPFG